MDSESDIQYGKDKFKSVLKRALKEILAEDYSPLRGRLFDYRTGLLQ